MHHTAARLRAVDTPGMSFLRAQVLPKSQSRTSRINQDKRLESYNFDFVIPVKHDGLQSRLTSHRASKNIQDNLQSIDLMMPIS